MYRGEMHGQLPFDVKGMDDAVPTIDFTPSRVADPPYSLERTDVDGTVLPFCLSILCLSGRLTIYWWHIPRSARRIGRS